MPKHKLDQTCGKAILAFSQGDKNALSTLYDCMARMIFTVAYAITGNYQDAEDVLQETMIQIAKHAPAYQDNGSAKAWILTIARHLSIDIVRKRKGAIPFEESGVWKEAGDHTGFSQLEALDLLSVLSEEERQLVIFRLYMIMPYAEIAQIMKVSVSSAQKKYQRSIQKLKRCDF